jgi:hypothetical protein
MFLTILGGIFLVLVAGVILKFAFARWGPWEYQIDNKEFLISALVLTFIAVPAVTYVGYQVAISNQVTYHEDWNGWETSADKDVITCSRDGPCTHEYDCDPYTVRERYDCSTTDSKGKRQPKTCYRNVTKYHSCPYTTEEWTFSVSSTVQDWTIASHNLPTNPDSHRWRASHSVPGYIPSGVPPRWQQVVDRLAAGKPNPVVIRHDYDNYLLASHSTIMVQYSAAVDTYKKAGLFPAINSSVYDLYYLNRAYFVGINPSGDWQGAMARFDSAFGYSLTGDMHLVIVDANKITNPDEYKLALLAYWLSPDFAKETLSKNGLVVILGTKDGQTVEWARASTGMPLGNEDLLQQIESEMKGVSLTPDAVLGSQSATVTGRRSVTLHHTDGALEKIVWGPNAFKRVHMKAHGDNSTGFEYLLKELEPTDSQQMWILFGSFMAGLIAWGICLIRQGRE